MDQSSSIMRRKTFAIISHPDAGKTTLTEKLLLYSGAIDLAGSVKAKKSQRHAVSDWMKLEQERGISVTSAVLQFENEGQTFNLLDTPGHNDFSADTYRTLTAADCAVMVVDYAKGVEPQTEKLFEVASARGIPIFTFVNKCDQSGLGPLDLLSNIEEKLGLACAPINWPVAPGPEFNKIFERASGKVHIYDRTAHNASVGDANTMAADDERLKSMMRLDDYARFRDEIELLDVAGDWPDPERIAAGRISPVFFGSALKNVGLDVFLEHFRDLAPGPQPRKSTLGMIEPDSESFSGFVFKIQANMNPQHRDRVAFMRVVSGVFDRGMNVLNSRTGAQIRLSHSQRLFGRERETLEQAHPGDIVAVSSTDLQLGDTLSTQAGLAFDEVPAFPPENFGVIHNLDATRFKQYQKGLEQLASEGLAELFTRTDSGTRDQILGVVGVLQFDVIQYRLEAEYGVRTKLNPIPHEHVAWVAGPAGSLPSFNHLGGRVLACVDLYGNRVIVCQDKWSLGRATQDLEGYVVVKTRDALRTPEALAVAK
jgi:peptide chain release factor 3